MFHISSELVTDLFNPFALEFLVAFEHLLGVMDVVYYGQLPPAWGDRGHALSHFHQLCRVSTPFVIWPNFAQKNVPNQRTLKYQELTGNSMPKSESDRYIYPQFYIDFTP